MASFLDDVFEDVLDVLNEVIHGEHDCTQLIELQTHLPSGALITFRSLQYGWAKEPVSLGFGVFAEEFQIAARLLTEQLARKVHAVRFAEVVHVIEERVAPKGLDRFWRLKIKPVERVM